MTEQQQFRPGDRVKVTMELTVAGTVAGTGETVYPGFIKGAVYPSTVERWADECDHITVELIERPEPPREPGWYLCAYADAPRAIRWDGTMWRWAESGMCVINQDKVDVLGTVTLEEGVEL